MSERYEKEVAEQLKKVEAKLLDPPSSAKELLYLLNEVDDLLSRVAQSPSKSIEEAINPITIAVGSDTLFRQTDVDVKVAVASCISEITRITAPQAPYGDDKMKEVFELIVSAFDGLSDKTSRSFRKRVRILETVARVRSCVVMLDLECDDLIVKMFNLFLANIKHYHSDVVFSAMETVMVLVIKESEEISSDLLTPLLEYLKKDNRKEATAVKLVEKVVLECADTLKPYLSEAVKSLEDYAQIVTTVCASPPATVEHENGNASADLLVPKVDDDIPVDTDEDVSVQPNAVDAVETVSEPPNAVDAGETVSEPPKLAMANGVNESGKEFPGADTKGDSPVGAIEKSQESSADKSASKSEDDESETQGPLEVESNIPEVDTISEGVDTISGGKPNSSMNASESSDTSNFTGEKEVDNQSDKDSHDSLREEDADMDAGKNISSPDAADADAGITASSSQNDSLHDDDRPKQTGRPKNKKFTSKKKGPVKKAPPKKKDESSSEEDTSVNESEEVDESEKKPMKQLGKKKKMDESSTSMDEYAGDSKRRKTKPTSENKATKTAAKTSAKNDQKKIAPGKSSSKSSKAVRSSEETPREIPKRKRDTELDGSIVGSRVKIWWALDEKYYPGVIQSYSHKTKKHTILYDDKEKEILLLKKERWEFTDDDSNSSEERDAETSSPESASGLRKRAVAKLNPKPSGKSNKNGAASSSKAKGAASSSLSKGKSKQTSSSKPKEDTLKIGGKSKPDTGVKSKAKAGDDGNAGKTRSKEKVPDVPKPSGGKGKGKVQEVKGSTQKRRRTG